MNGIGATAMQFNKEISEFQKAHRIAVTQIKNLPIGLFPLSGQQKRVDTIIDVVEVAKLLAFPDFKGAAFKKQPHPDTNERLSGVHAPHSGTIGVGQPKGTSPDSIYVVVKDVIPLTSHFVDSVHIHRPDGMFFIDWQIIGFSINLAGAGKNNLDVGIRVTARFQEGELWPTVYFQVSVRTVHGVHMAGLTPQGENDVMPLYQVFHAVLVAYV